MNKRKWFLKTVFIIMAMVVAFALASCTDSDVSSAMASCSSSEIATFKEQHGIPKDATYSEIKWPDNDVAKSTPIPESNMGWMQFNCSSGFSVYIVQTSEDDYSDYIQTCKDAGYTKKCHFGENYYMATNKSNYELLIKYDGDGVMFVRNVDKNYANK